MTLPTRSAPYCAYLLRCWHATNQAAADAQGWRFILEDPSTGARRSFASFDALVSFLRDTLSSDPGGSASAPVDEQVQ